MNLHWDPFNRYPTEVYHYRSGDPELDLLIHMTPWDFIPDWTEDEGDNPWTEDDSWMEEEPEGWPDPNDW
jgi:hypothetical protein